MLTDWCYSSKHIDITAGSKPPSFYHIQKAETTYTFVYAYIFLNRTCWVHIMLLVCMFSGRPFGTGQSVGAPRTTSPTPSFPQLPVVHRLLPMWFGMLTGVLLLLLVFEQSWWWDLMGVASDVTGDTVSQQTLILRPWQSFRLSSAMFPEPLGQQCFIDASICHSNGNFD